MKRYLIFLAVVLVAIGSWFAWSRFRPHEVEPAADDPRLSYATPYRNVRPEVQYVGDDACARCHADQFGQFRRHPMGRSMGLVSQVAPIERFDEPAHNPFRLHGFLYQVLRQGDRILHRETKQDSKGEKLAEVTAEVQFELGSGTRGRSYLVNREGCLFQSPISWYSQEGRWDIAPGYKEGTNAHFERPITAGCLFCHSNQADPVEHTINRYKEPIFRGMSIGCERCHGPGALHVQRREREETIIGLDDTIVNPRRLEPALREAVCQQCHLQGEKRVVREGRGVFDYRPGLPLHKFLSIYVRPEDYTDNSRSVNHVQQMYASRCFRESVGKMSCTSCHDPHRKPEPVEEVAFYRNRCLNCHAQRGCSVAEEVRRQTVKDDSCFQCHMPQADSSNIAHTAVTDHRILRKPMPIGPAAPPRRLRPGEYPLVHFHRELVGVNDKGALRDLGIALVELAGPQTAGPLAHMALPLLETACKECPRDVSARESMGMALFLLKRDAESLAAYEGNLERIPERESSLVGAATAATSLGRNELAADYWRRARSVNPWRSEYHAKLAAVLKALGQEQGAAEACEAALKLNPADLETRKTLIECYRTVGADAKAQAEEKRVQAWGNEGGRSVK